MQGVQDVLEQLDKEPPPQVVPGAEVRRAAWSRNGVAALGQRCFEWAGGGAGGAGGWGGVPVQQFCAFLLFVFLALLVLVLYTSCTPEHRARANQGNGQADKAAHGCTFLTLTD